MDIIYTLIGSATIGGVIVWLGKLVVNRGFDAALEAHRSELQKLDTEHRIRFSRLHEDRVQQSKLLYQELVELEKALEHYTSMFQGDSWGEDEARKQPALDRIRSCETLLETNRIYFPDSFCQKLGDTIDECKSIVREMMKAKRKERQYDIALEKGRQPTPLKDGEWPIDRWAEQEERVKNDIRKRRLEIAHEVRLFFGAE